MDHRSFDDLAKLLGAARTRRAGLRAALGGLLGAAVGAAVATEAPARRRRKKCDPPCAAGQTCRKGSCACDNGGTVCAANCCLIGQRCEGGQCVELPNPDACIAYAEPCKNVGRPCCENLQCGSGQGGQDDVACWVRKTGRCTSTAECIFGTECVDGICIAVLPPPPGPTCVVERCPVCSGYEEAEGAVEPACIGDACGCTCLQGSNGFVGAGCTFGGSECSSYSGGTCMDMMIDDPCAADSDVCCCRQT